LVNRLGVDESQLSPETSFIDDLHVDSLGFVELLMSLEDEFSTDGATLDIPDEDAERLVTIQDVVDYLKKHGIKDS